MPGRSEPMPTPAEPSVTTPDGVAGVLDDGRPILRFERRFKHPVDRVWQALTDPEHTRQWLGTAELELVVGGRVAFSFLDQGQASSDEVWNWTITELDPPTLIEYATPEGILRWELRTERQGCLLHFSFIVQVGERLRNSIAAGWHWHLDALVSAVHGQPVDWSTVRRERIEQLYFRYRNKTTPGEHDDEVRP